MAEVFRIDIVASPTQAVRGVRQVETELERLNRTAASTNSLLAGALRLTGLGVGLVAVQRLARGFQDLSDAFTQIQNRLTVVTSGTEQLRQTTDALLGVANDTRTSFEATAQLYARTALASRELGLSQETLLGITESVNQAIILSGASSKEASNGLIQLSQAIASNRLAGDELRSVLEQLPVVADIIAKRLQVTRGELRELGRQGKITADVIIGAFQDARAELSDRFGKTVPTISQAFTILENNLISFIGRLSQVAGIGSTVATVLAGIGANLENLALIAGAFLAVIAGRQLFEFVADLERAVRVQREFASSLVVGSDSVEVQSKAILASRIARQQEVAETIRQVQEQRRLSLLQLEGAESARAGLAVDLQATAAKARLTQASVDQARELQRGAAESTAAFNDQIAAARLQAEINVANASLEAEAAAARVTAARKSVDALRDQSVELRSLAAASEAQIRTFGTGEAAIRPFGAAIDSLNAKTAAGLSIQREQALEAARSVEARQVEAVAALQGAAAESRQAEASLDAARAARQRAASASIATEAVEVQTLLQEQLAAAETAQATAAQRVVAAETRLTEAVTAGNTARAQQEALTRQLTLLQDDLARATARVAAAEAAVAKAAAPVPGVLSRITAVLARNPFAATAVAVSALVLLFVDLKEEIEVIRTGVTSMATGFFSAVTAIRETAAAVPVLGDNLRTLVNFVGAAGLAFAALRIRALSTFKALSLGLGAVILLAGELATALDKMNADLVATGDALARNSFAERFARARGEVERLTAQVARIPEELREGSTAQIKLNDAVEKFNALDRERRRLQNAARESQEDPLERRLRELRDQVGLLGKVRRERELEVDLLREKNKLEKEGVNIAEGSKQETELRATLARVQAVEQLNSVLDDVRARRAPDFSLEEQRALLDQAGLSAEEYAAALSALRDLSLTPLQRQLKDLRDASRLAPTTLGDITVTGTESPRAMLETFQRLNREREVQLEIEQRLLALGPLSAAERTAARSEIEPLVRANAERERRNDLDLQFLEQRSEQADAQALALIPDDFERQVQAALQAQRDLKDASLQQTEAQIRQNLAIQEMGSVLSSSQDPVVAQQRAQQLVADQIARTNDLMASGAITAQQYAAAMAELNFRAAAVGTTFTDGVVVALRQMQASTTEATLGAAALTGAINSAADAAAEFVRTGTIDFRQLALSLIADITRIIVKLLILKAIQAATRTGGVPLGQSGFDANTDALTFTGSGFDLRAEGGPFRANRPFIVGERGPELVQFGRSGFVTPNDRVAEAMAQAGARGGGTAVVPAPAVNVSVVNVSDPDAALDAMDTPAGARVILNHMARNPQAARRAIGG